MPKPRKRLLTFNDPTPLRIDRRLAMEIGFLESVVLLQLEFLISISAHVRDGQFWTYQTLQDLKNHHFPWLSIPTISRVLKSLEDMGLIVVSNYNRSSFDRTRWFALGYDGIRELKSVMVGEDAPISQNEKWNLQIEKSMFHPEKSILQIDTSISQVETSISRDVTTIPENSAENYTETTTRDGSEQQNCDTGTPVELVVVASRLIEERQFVTDQLCARGVTRRNARKLAETHEPDEIHRQMAMLDYRKAEEPAAVLVKAIEQGWAPPEAYVKAEKRRLKAERAVVQQCEHDRTRQAEVSVREERDACMEAVWNNLSDAQRQELEQRARAILRKRNPSMVQFFEKNPEGPITRAMFRGIRDELIDELQQARPFLFQDTDVS